MLTIYYGIDQLLVKHNFLGLGEMRTSHIGLFCIIGVQILTIVNALVTNLYYGRNTKEFEQVWGGKRMFMIHVSYIFILSAVFMSYQSISPSFMNENPVSMMFAICCQYLQGTLRCLIAGVTKEQY